MSIPHHPLPLTQFDSFSTSQNLVHAVTTRHGGVSVTPWASLNLGGSVGDDPAAVDENHNRMCAALGVQRGHLVTGLMTHGRHVAVVDQTDWGRRLPDTDALVTQTPGVYLALRFADCVPVLFYDPRLQVVGMAHAGWRGTLALIAQATALTMISVFGSRPADIRVGIGPSIGPCCYEVGDDVIAHTQAVFNGNGRVLRQQGVRQHLDLWLANRLQLEQVGVRHIETAEICTACHVHDYYSHRAEKGRTGRFGAVIGIPA